MLVSASFYCIFCIKDCNLSLLRVEIIGLVSYLRREGRRGGGWSPIIKGREVVLLFNCPVIRFKGCTAPSTTLEKGSSVSSVENIIELDWLPVGLSIE